MKYFRTTEKPTMHIYPEAIEYAKFLFGSTVTNSPATAPKGSSIIGMYTDSTRTGALIMLANGNKVCGYCGIISQIPQKCRTVNTQEHGNTL